MIHRLTTLALTASLALSACSTPSPAAKELTHAEKIEAATLKPQIGGYCPVAYVDAGAPVRGVPEHPVATDDGVFWFVNADAADSYERDRGRYQVPFLNYDPNGLAEGQVVYADPTIFTIHDGKIYLFADDASRQAFLEDADAIVAGAQAFFDTFE
jgi:hypothetical protein